MSFLKDILWSLIDPEGFRMLVKPQEALSILESSKISTLIFEESKSSEGKNLPEIKIVFDSGVSVRYSEYENYQFMVFDILEPKPTLFVFDCGELMYLKIGVSEKIWKPPSQEYKQHSNLLLERLRNEVDMFIKSGGR